ncbi:sensor domain-containing diguanylate cyclase [Oceanirhabdus sp. W0125-5]|uniref:sensor domain-containing diguanylate cyclase n=1 Tax=Oceanirhabdus sp. W0125-5 TaxID=2999116 RepID=UPI0022F31A20|nr:sensor domain-containing diguanylate cyclase [Oceanirhabdus sp. W0125-5]WBW96515.1 sensor domain-containing diguanylate cyclase [Oceanirhabdus sp. W0125-5]
MLRSWVEDQIRVVKMISTEPKIINLCRFPENEEVVEEGHKFLLHIHDLYPYYENLPISVKLHKPIEKNVNGNEVTINSGEFLVDTVGGETIGKGGMGYSYVEEIFKGKDYFISEIYPSILRDNPIFVISAPIKYNDEIIGVAIISPQMDYFTKTFVDNVNFKQTGYQFFIDDRGAIISHPNRSFILDLNQKTKDIGKGLLKRFSKNEYFFEDNIYQNSKYYIGTKVNFDQNNIKHNWYIVFTQARKEVYNNSNRFLGILIAMIFIVTAVVVWAIYLVSKINQKEIYESKLKKLNEDLECKVEERTKVLKRLSVTDSLTNLFNHQTIYKKLDGELNRAKNDNFSVYIIMADIDHFKRVNDTYGHQIGDQVIVKTAKIILSNIKRTHIAGRYGGEEFLAILSDIEWKEAMEIAEKIKQDISSMEFIHKELKVTISIGLCKWEGESYTDLVNKADRLLYKAKELGRNRIEV